MAARCRPRATKLTGAPAVANRAPMYPPMAPAPITAIRMAGHLPIPRRREARRALSRPRPLQLRPDRRPPPTAVPRPPSMESGREAGSGTGAPAIGPGSALHQDAGLLEPFDHVAGHVARHVPGGVRVERLASARPNEGLGADRVDVGLDPDGRARQDPTRLVELLLRADVVVAEGPVRDRHLRQAPARPARRAVHADEARHDGAVVIAIPEAGQDLLDVPSFADRDEPVAGDPVRADGQPARELVFGQPPDGVVRAEHEHDDPMQGPAVVRGIRPDVSDARRPAGREPNEDDHDSS